MGLPYATAGAMNSSSNKDQPPIPVIDVVGVEQGGARVVAVGRQMLRAAEQVGFFYIANHPIPTTLIAEVFDISARFFASSQTDKQTLKVNSGHRGFITIGEAKMEGGTRPDLKESFIWGLDEPGPDGIPPNQWPAFLPEMRTILTEFFSRGNQLGWWVLRCLAAALDIEEEAFVRSIDRPISRGSLIYYPPQPQELGDQQFGVSPHTDYGCLTLLYQDNSGGLEVRGRQGTWLQAHPIPGTFVVNVGDLMARWTNDRFLSTPHRVINRSDHARFSTGLFVDPNDDTIIRPVVKPGEQPHYDPVTCGEYFRSRLDASFKYRQQSESARA
jgi:isopenicillin N synthase-like dioxygenase